MEDFPGIKPPKTVDGNSFTDSTIYGLFIKFNSPLPSSAAIERLFSLGKVMLKPKRSSLTDEHFDAFERKLLNCSRPLQLAVFVYAKMLWWC